MQEIEAGYLRQFANYILHLSGTNYTEDNWLGLKVVIKERMFETKINFLQAYYDYLSGSSSGREERISFLSVPGTYFFRDKRQFEVLRDHLLPEMISVKKKILHLRPHIKIVSCGCSTGQEPYSIAIEQSGLRDQADFNIIALDINKKSIHRAQDAEYTANSFREPNTLPEIMHYFISKDKKFILRDEIRKQVRFHSANLFNTEETVDILNGSERS
jgi:chemotaxis protein methyltransferase CheR